MTFGQSIKGNLHDFLPDQAEIYETVLFKKHEQTLVFTMGLNSLNEFYQCVADVTKNEIKLLLFKTVQKSLIKSILFAWDHLLLTMLN